MVARLRERTRGVSSVTIDGNEVPCWRVGYDDVVDGLPEPREGELLLVSRVLAGVVRRDDLVFPYPEVRDEHGVIVGCGGLAHFDHDGTVLSGTEGA